MEQLSMFQQEEQPWPEEYEVINYPSDSIAWLPRMSCRESAAWVNNTAKHVQRFRAILYRMHIAAGRGDHQQRCKRLMAAVGSWFTFRSIHSGLIDPLLILLDKAAWCDQVARVFAFCAYYLLGLPARWLSIVHIVANTGHFVCEVYYDNKWHLFDPQFDHMSVFKDENNTILSYKDIMCNLDLVVKEDNQAYSSVQHGKVGLFMQPPKAIGNMPFEPIFPQLEAAVLSKD